MSGFLTVGIDTKRKSAPGSVMQWYRQNRFRIILTHCNFGWKGAWDGYYYPWAFDTALRQGYDKGEIIGDDPALFDTGLKMFVYL